MNLLNIFHILHEKTILVNKVYGPKKKLLLGLKNIFFFKKNSKNMNPPSHSLSSLGFCSYPELQLQLNPPAVLEQFDFCLSHESVSNLHSSTSEVMHILIWWNSNINPLITPPGCLINFFTSNYFPKKYDVILTLMLSIISGIWIYLIIK